jgi:hypothetical protein
MKLISDVGSDAGYGSVTAAHMEASAAALTELARLVTAGTRAHGTRPLHVRLSHFEHGGLLSLQLFGFPVLPAAGHSVTIPTPPGVEEMPPATGLRAPGEASAQAPMIYAVVANHSVPVQIEHTLAELAALVARQELISVGKGVNVGEIDKLAATADTQATTAVTDTLRSQGWRAAAQAVSARSVAAGVPLDVTYSPVLMDATALALRAPILRRVYNELPGIRNAIDNVAATLSQSLITVGGSSEQVAAYVRNQVEAGSIRTYLAHLARDAFVCGNGYLSFGGMPDEDIRLLRPELVTVLEPDKVRVSDGDTDVIYRSVLHETGAEQYGSSYGLSVLEPFVNLQTNRELMLQTLEFAEAYAQPSAPESVRTKALENVPLARRTLDSIDSQVAATLGGPMTLQVQLPADLYFPGHEFMAPTAAGLALVAGESSADPGAGGTGQ